MATRTWKYSDRSRLFTARTVSDSGTRGGSKRRNHGIPACPPAWWPAKGTWDYWVCRSPPMLHLAFESGGPDGRRLVVLAALECRHAARRSLDPMGIARRRGGRRRHRLARPVHAPILERPHRQPLTAWLGGKTIVGGLLGAILGVETAKRLLHWHTSTGRRLCRAADGGDGDRSRRLPAFGHFGSHLWKRDDAAMGMGLWAMASPDIRRHLRNPRHRCAGVVHHAEGFTTRQGDRFRAFVVGYLLLRIGLDFLKPPFGPASAGALVPERWGALSVIQWACVAGLAYYGRDIYRWATQGRPIA